VLSVIMRVSVHVTISESMVMMVVLFFYCIFFFSSRRRHTSLVSDWSSDVCSSDLGEFQNANTEIFGVSRDSIRVHKGFKEKYAFPFELISDPDESLCELFDVIKQKKLYGKEYMGIERSTFLINSYGVLAQEWRKVKVKGHVDEVLTAINNL